MRRAVVLLCCLVLLSACGAQAGAGTTRPMLTLGAVYPLAGAQGSGGRQELAGVRAALRVAEQEGLLDQRVRLLVRSVQTPEQARQAVDGLIHQDHVPVIFGTYGSTLSYAAALEANRLHTIYWESGAVADLITQRREYVFRTVATGMTLGDSAVNFTDQVLLPRAGLKASQATAVIVNVDDVYGRSVADGEQALAARLGIHVLQRIQYPAQSYDPSVIAQEVAADHPDYLWDVSYLSDGEAIWKAIKASGVTLRAAIGTSSAFCLPQFGQQMGQLAVGTYAADHPSDEISPDALTPAARTLLGEAKDAYAALGYGHQMQIVGVAGFVAGWTLFHGVLPHVQGTVTPDRVRTVAYRINEPVGSSINGGGVRFAQPGSSDAGQNLRAPSIVGQWQAVDVWRTVWPMSYATAEPQGNSW